MNIDQQFPSKWLNADDLLDKASGRWKETNVTIEEVLMEKVGRDTTPVVYFEGKRKGLVLNAQRAKQIKTALDTAETDEWIGHRVALYVAPGTNGGNYINVKESKANGASREPSREQPREQPRERAAAATSDSPPPRDREPVEQRARRAEIDDSDVPF